MAKKSNKEDLIIGQRLLCSESHEEHVCKEKMVCVGGVG